MLNQDYIQDCINKRKRLLEDRVFTVDELEEIFGEKTIFDFGVKANKGLTITPVFKIQTIKVKGKKRIVPFIGIKGTF